MERLRITALLVAAALPLLSGCDPQLSTVVALELPPWPECEQTYIDRGVSGQELFWAGDTRAARCMISAGQDRGELWHNAFRTRYLIYMVEEIEPEGLDALVRSTDRQDLAASIRNAHRILRGLEPIGSHWLTNCPTYPPRTRELLLRAPLGEDRYCLPRGQR